MKLIEDLKAHRAANSKRCRYPEAMRDSVVAHFEQALARGERRRDIAEQLGVDQSTINVWREAKRPRERFVQVRAESMPSATTRIVLHAGAVRIEGMGADDVARVLRALGC